MKSGIKIIHWIVIIWLSIAILRIELIIDYLSLIFSFFGLLIRDYSSALTFLNFGLVDASLSVILFLLIIPVLIIFRKRLRFLTTRLNFSFAFVSG